MWPASQKNGNHPYRELGPTELGTPVGTVTPDIAQRTIRIPWGVGGYTRARVSFSVTPAAPAVNGWSLVARCMDSGGGLAGPVTYLLPGGSAGMALAAGANLFMLAWDDSVLPGNLIWESGGVQTNLSLPLNPTWQMNGNIIEFLFGNATGGAVTWNNVQVALRG